MARTNRPDEVYHIPKLNFWFAISAFVLLITSVLIVVADHTRSWKNTQRDFRQVERNRLELMKEKAQAALAEEDKQAELQKLQKAVTDAEAALSQQRADVENQRGTIKRLELNDYYVAKQDYNFAKATLGEVKFHTEHVLEKYPDTPKAEEALHHYECETYKVEGPDKAAQDADCGLGADFKSLRTKFLDQEDALLVAQTRLEELMRKVKGAQAAVDQAHEDLIAVEKRMAPIAANLFNDAIRDSPIMDFLAPSLKIKQTVITDIRDNYNFAMVQKEDRCETCHLGINNKEYILDPASGRFSDEFTRGAMENELMAELVEFVESQVPADDRSYVKEELATFKEKAEMSLAEWAKETIDNETLTEKMMEYTADAREELRVRTKTYSAHPNLDLFLSSVSPHPQETTGCSVCHEGRGHATEFVRSYHTPQNEEQEAEWQEKYGWHPPHHWDSPQLPVGRVTASCAKCHDSEPFVETAANYNEGRHLVEQSGCYGCHRIAGITGEIREAGPALTKVASKIDKNFAYQWIWNPKDFRPTTRMPVFFGQSNNGDGEFLARTQQEVRSIVGYLWANQDSYEVGEVPVQGDGERGEQLFREVGCLGCHSKTDENFLVNDHGPDLTGIGSKLSAGFIYQWIREPRGYFARTHMPSLRLTEKEAADITEYLVAQRKDDWVTKPMPARDDALQETILRETLATSTRRSELDALMSKMTADEKEVMLGERTLLKYGCTGCHMIKGLEDAQPIGVELTTWASKFTTQLDFGLFKPSKVFGDEGVDFTHIKWASMKLTNPRVFDEGKADTKTFAELLKMPNFKFTEDQIDKIVTFLMSRTKRVIPENRVAAGTDIYANVQKGRALAKQYNCYGCHYFDGQGGNIAQYWKRDGQLAVFTKPKERDEDFDFDYLTHVPGPVRGFVPPVLLTQGDKTHPDWLFGFLHNVKMLRPQLKMRMPSFQFSDEEANIVLRYFAGLEGKTLGTESSFEPSAQAAVLGQELFKRGKCTQCHMFENRDVPKDRIPVNVVAPNLKLARERLQPEWIARWMANPQELMPGANMPSYFDVENKFSTLDMDGSLLEGDVHQGIDAIRDYLLIAGESYVGTSTAQR